MDSRNFQFMFYGFTAAWLIVFVYVVTLVRRGNRLRAELKRHEAVSERAGDHPLS
jgi:CcmD family protein